MRKLFIGLAILLIVISWVNVINLNEGLVVTDMEVDGVSLRYIAPEGGQDLPGIVIAHGFAVSKQLMYGFGQAFARAGYGVMFLDFSGHGATANPMPIGPEALQADLQIAYETLVAQPEIDGENIVALGHSMGSGVVMQAGFERVDQYQAVIAVSPSRTEVSSTAPKNLLLMAGSLERPFVRGGQRILTQAGGESTDFENQAARHFEIIKNVEHIMILFNPVSQNMAVDWANKSLSREGGNTFADTRAAWYGLHLLGWLVLSAAVGPIKIQTEREPIRLHGKRFYWALLFVPFIGVGVLGLLQVLFNASTFMNFQVGGGLGIWLFLVGIGWLFYTIKPTRPDSKSILWGLVLFGMLSASFGLMGHFTWLNWLLPAGRVWRWVVLAVLCVPWKLAVGAILQNVRGWKAVGFWLLHSGLLVAALVVMGITVRSMFIVILMVPLLPLVLGIEQWIGRRFESAWAYAVGTAMFFAWILASLFPIVV